MHAELVHLRESTDKLRTVTWANEPAATLEDVVVEVASVRAMLDSIECEALDVPAVIAALDRAMPRIRFELASDIHRKKLPSVRFVVLPRGAPT